MTHRWPVIVLVLLGPAASVQAAFHAGACYVNTESEFETAVDTFEPDSAGYKVFAGFNPIRFLGFEASYRDLGDHEERSGPDEVDAEIEVIDAAARGILPFKIVSLFAKAGYAKISTDGSVDVGGTFEDFDEDDWEPFYGAGVDVHLGKHLGLRAEWEAYEVDTSLNSLSVGAFLRF